MQPVTISLTDHTRGDTWEGATIGPVLFDDVQPPYALSSCRWQFRRENTGVLGETFSSSDGSITIDDADTWELTIDSVVLSLSVGVWDWDFETVDANGDIRTLYVGQLAITEDISR